MGLTIKTIVVILAAGSGERLNGKKPKQFLKIGGKAIIDIAIEAFVSSRLISGIVAVLPADRRAYSLHPWIDFVAVGGETRMESSYSGLLACPGDTETVLIHDAVRPFVDAEIIKRCIDALVDFQGVAPAIPSSDSLSEVEGNSICGLLERQRIFRNQTPQAFRYRDIRDAYEKATFRDFTDDISLAYASGLKCGIVEGSPANIKITYPLDMFLAEQVFRSRK